MPEQIPLAISYLDTLEGEYIPKSEQRENTNQRSNSHMYAHNINALLNHYDTIYTTWNTELYPALRSVDSPIAGRLYDRFKDGYAFLMLLHQSITGKYPALIK